MHCTITRDAESATLAISLVTDSSLESGWTGQPYKEAVCNEYARATCG